jgi:hypothetical protein
MTLKDKIEMKAQDTTKIYLNKEGIFYIRYHHPRKLLRLQLHFNTIKTINLIVNN